MTRTLMLPTVDGGRTRHVMTEPAPHSGQAPPPTSRTAYAAAHVVADPLRAAAAGGPGAVDWEATVRQRHRIWSLGLGVAEAMDTAQRGMGIAWPDVQRLVRESLAAARDVGGATVVGIATDSLPAGGQSLDRIRDAYLEQLDFVEGLGGTAVVMASRQLAASAQAPDDYVKVYDAVLSSARRPVVLHWLGNAFDPALTGYWGSDDLDAATEVVRGLLRDHADRVDGIKMSLLDPAREIAMRRAAPASVKVYTGDDFNYVDLIADRDGLHSHALLGAFAALAPVARAALGRLDEGDEAGYRELLEPTLPLSRLVFESPTAYYKTGIVWLAYLQGQQDHFRMLGGLESGRSVAHLVEIFVEADRIGLLHDPDLAADRMAAVLALHGLD
jgi:hypothetical protein